MEALDVINAQGAQVTALRQQNEELSAIIKLIAGKHMPATTMFNKQDLEKANDITVVWRASKNGNVTVTVTRKKGKK